MMLNLNAVECDLALDALKFYRSRIDYANTHGSVCSAVAHTWAGEFTNRQIDNLVVRIEAIRPKP